MDQIFGKFFIYDEKLGHFNENNVNLNVIKLQDLDGSLLIFRIKGTDEERHDFQEMVRESDFLDGIESSIMVLNDDIIAGIDIVDIDEAEKFTLRKLNPERVEKEEKKIRRQTARQKLVEALEKHTQTEDNEEDE